MFDEEPDGDPHGECAAEIHRLQALLQEFIDLCAAGDIDENTDDGLGWGALVRDAKAALGRSNRLTVSASETVSPDEHKGLT